MKLKCPKGVTSINVAGIEYATDNGVVIIDDQQHVEAALKNGFAFNQAETLEALETATIIESA